VCLKITEEVEYASELQGMSKKGGHHLTEWQCKGNAKELHRDKQTYKV
jgi:hypothetical protein